MSMPPYVRHPFFLAGGNGALSQVQLDDLGRALALSEEVSPCPAAAHTALLILRSTLAKALDLSVTDLFSATGTHRADLSVLPEMTLPTQEKSEATA